MSARCDLPNRRPHFVGPLIEWAGVRWLIGVGLDESGVAKEVFADPADFGVEIEPAIVTLVHEASITVSHLLQHGVAARVHAARIAGNAPAILTLMLRRAADLEAEHGAYVRQLYAFVEERQRTGTVRVPEFADVSE